MPPCSFCTRLQTTAPWPRDLSLPGPREAGSWVDKSQWKRTLSGLSYMFQIKCHLQRLEVLYLGWHQMGHNFSHWGLLFYNLLWKNDIARWPATVLRKPNDSKWWGCSPLKEGLMTPGKYPGGPVLTRTGGKRSCWATSFTRRYKGPTLPAPWRGKMQHLLSSIPGKHRAARARTVCTPPSLTSSL